MCSGFRCFPPFCTGFFPSLWIYPPVICVVADFQIQSLSGCPDCWWWSYFCFLVFLLTVWPLCFRTAEVHFRPFFPGDHLQWLQNSKGCCQFLLLLFLSQKDTRQLSVWSLLYEVTLWIYGCQGAVWGDCLYFIVAQVLSCELRCSFRAARQVRLSLLQQNS